MGLVKLAVDGGEFFFDGRGSEREVREVPRRI